MEVVLLNTKSTSQNQSDYTNYIDNYNTYKTQTLNGLDFNNIFGDNLFYILGYEDSYADSNGIIDESTTDLDYFPLFSEIKITEYNYLPIELKLYSSPYHKTKKVGKITIPNDANVEIKDDNYFLADKVQLVGNNAEDSVINIIKIFNNTAELL